MLTKEKKAEIMDAVKRSPKDTGSSVVQIALLTERINKLTDHFKISKKDHASKRGFLKLVGDRNKLLSYLRKHNMAEYNKVTEKYNIKKRGV